MKRFYINSSLIALLFFSTFSMLSCKHEVKQKEPAAIQGNPLILDLNEKILKDPKNANLYFQRASKYYKDEAYDESIADLQTAIKLDSLQPQYYHLLADAYLDYYKSRQALETMEKLTNLFPKRIESLLKYAEFQLILKQYSEGQLTVQRILQVDPQNAEAYLMGGMLFKEMGDQAKARAGFQKAVELGLTKPEDLIDAYINLGNLNLKKDKKLAELYFNNALRVDSVNINALHAKAEYFKEIGQLNKSLETYRKIVGIDHHYEAAFFNSGLIYASMDSLKKAYQNFNIAVSINPTEASYYYYRGTTQLSLGHKNEAIADFEQTLKLDKNFVKATKALRAIK